MKSSTAHKSSLTAWRQTCAHECGCIPNSDKPKPTYDAETRGKFRSRNHAIRSFRVPTILAFRFAQTFHSYGTRLDTGEPQNTIDAPNCQGMWNAKPTREAVSGGFDAIVFCWSICSDTL